MGLIKDFHQLKNFLLLWFGQSISALGSSMTSFAITIWAYRETGSALTLSISGLLILLPKMAGGLLAGPLVDRMNKKTVMLCTDIGAGFCSLALFLLLWTHRLEIWHIYCLNFISSILGSFQSPAHDVTVSLIVPKENYIKTNGFQAFSNGTVQILSPVLAAFFLSFTGMVGVILFDFATLLFACSTLALFVRIPNIKPADRPVFNMKAYSEEFMAGFRIVMASKLLRTLLLFLAFINLVAGITYYNLLSPMILARSGNSAEALSLVNGAIGLGGVVGGLLVTFVPPAKYKTKATFLCAALSFIFGDTLLALGHTVPVWAVAGFLSSVFLPFIGAHNNYFWRTIIPIELQGRAFSFKYALQSGTVPLGLLIGGVLADFVFEPFMMNSPTILSNLLGSSKGEGMALMFLISGVLGAGISMMGFFSSSLQKEETKVVSTPAG